MDRVELLAAAVHQAWFSALTGVDADVPDWLSASDAQRSAAYHAVRFLEELDVENYTTEKLSEASAFAWSNFLKRGGHPEVTPGPLQLKAMIRTYLVMRHVLGTPAENWR